MDVFTDREGICGQDGSFMSKYNDHREKQHVIIYIHGMAGVGKTTLIEKLMLELIEKKNPNIIYYKLNKDRIINPDKEKENLLMDLACHILSRKPRQNMDRFLCAYGLLHNSNDPAGAVMEAMEKIKTRGDSIFSLGTAIVSDLLKRGGNTFSVMAGIIKRIVNSVKWKKIKKEFDGLNEDKIKDRLELYFYEDTKDYFAELKLPYVIFLDDFERYIRPGGEIGEESKKNWLMNFMHALPNVIWTVAGRDPIEWDKIYNRDDRRLPFEIDLKEFDKKDLVREFFDKYSDKYEAPRLASEMIDHIWKLTNGFPLYLGLCLDNYDMSEDKEHMTQEDFGKDLQELLERFYNNYSKQQQNAMLILCCLPDNWSEKLAFRLYDRIENRERYGLHLDQGLLDELTNTSAFTCEQGVYRIHEVVRKSVIKTAKGFNDKERLMLILNAQDSYAREYEQNDFRENALVYRENICFCLDEWSKTHEGADEEIAEAHLNCGYDYLYSSRLVKMNPEAGVKHIKKTIEIYERLYGEDDWSVLWAKKTLVNALVNCRTESRDRLDDEIERLVLWCYETVRDKHADEWEESITFLYYIWNAWAEQDGEPVAYLEKLIAEHEDEMDEGTADIAKKVREWRKYIDISDEIFNDPEYVESLNNMDDMYADEEEEIESGYNWFMDLSERENGEYSTEELKRMETLISVFGHFYRLDRTAEVSEKLYQILKEQNGGKDSKDTVRVLSDTASWFSDPVAGDYDTYIEYKERIWDILGSGEKWTEECAPGRALLDLCEALENMKRIEDALEYYRELSEEYDIYGRDIEMSKEEVDEKIDILENLVN